MTRANRYAPEVRERAVRMLLEQEPSYASQCAALTSIAGKIGCTPETLRKWVQRAEIDDGRLPGRTSSELEELKALKPEITRVWHENFQVYGARNICRSVMANAWPKPA